MPKAQSLNAIDSEKISTAALRTFLKIIDAWGLSQNEAMTILGYDENTRSTYFKWKRKPHSVKLQKEKLERLSYIFGIYKALQVLLPNESSADAWVKKPNSAPLFNGDTALNRMLSGNVADLYVVRRYLDAERGW
ncbi:MAG: antitoxin Xre/MbcA/ParS toxin-binding domain-containing protein [Granulosicoccus sp.]